MPDLLINGGGVTVWYFEWLKNLDHVAPGRLTKKYEERSKQSMIEQLGYRFPKDSPMMKKLQGATELDIVYSGLEEIMTTASRTNWETAVEKNISFRDACLGNAIKKVYRYYIECGIA